MELLLLIPEWQGENTLCVVFVQPFKKHKCTPMANVKVSAKIVLNFSTSFFEFFTLVSHKSKSPHIYNIGSSPLVD